MYFILLVSTHSHLYCCYLFFLSLFFFNDPATTEIYTLSLHDALPISRGSFLAPAVCSRTLARSGEMTASAHRPTAVLDRKSTRLNSSHQIISYAVFCLKKKKKNRHRNDLEYINEYIY